MGHQHGDACKHGHGHGGGHSHGGFSSFIKGIDLPSIVFIGIVTNILFWMFSSATTMPSIVALYIIVCGIVFGVLYRNAQGKLNNKMVAFATNFVGVNVMIFLISLLFVGGISQGFNQVLIHVDMTNYEIQPSYLKDLFGELKKRGSTGVLLEIDPKSHQLEEVAQYLKKSDLELVPIVSGRHQMEDVKTWLDSSIKFNKIHVGDPHLDELETIVKAYPQRNVTFLMWDSIGRDETQKLPTDPKYQYVIHPDHTSQSESEDPANWKVWKSFTLGSVWASCYYDDSDMFAIGERAQNTWRWVAIEKSNKVDMRGIIIMSKKVKEGHLGNLLPANLPLLALDLEVIKQRKDYRFIKKKVFHSLGLGNLHLIEVSKTVAGAGSRRGDFVGDDIFQLAAQYEDSREHKVKEELKKALVPKYYRSLPSFLN